MSFLKSLFKTQTDKLMEAVHHDDSTRVEKLLKNGTNPNILSKFLDKNGIAPLHLAAAKGINPNASLQILPLLKC
jgi:ankyrin repeat protein